MLDRTCHQRKKILVFFPRPVRNIAATIEGREIWIPPREEMAAEIQFHRVNILYRCVTSEKAGHNKIVQVDWSYPIVD